MGEWTIQSLGDIAFLEQILMGLSMMTGAGTVEGTVKIGLLLGVLLVMFRALMGGAKQIEIGHIAVAWIVYMGLFGNTTDVVIEDVYSGDAGWSLVCRSVSPHWAAPSASSATIRRRVLRRPSRRQP